MTQGSREAIIELLFLALYKDDHLSLTEDRVFSEALMALGWESEKSQASFTFAAFTAARAAAKDPVKFEENFNRLIGVVAKEGGETEALTWLTRVLAVDGLTSSEKRFLERIEKMLFPDQE